MNKEVHYEGWLIKSPPTKRIWRARWRRRWFTLKQGEIPEQFCLEYYTDRNCRKLKGVIDLDQCEQVDCGLRLENRKQKFQFMFDIKTPRRTYYLAADTEADMRDWVNCICQVCHLHDTKQSNDLQDDNQTQNVATSMSSSTLNTTNNTTTTSLNSSDNPTMGATRNSSSSEVLRRHGVTAIEQQPLGSATALTACENKEANAYVNTEYTNRETMLCDALLGKQQMPAPMKSAAPTQAPPQVAPPPPPPQAVAPSSRTIEVSSLSEAVPSPSQSIPSPSKAVPSLPSQIVPPPPSQTMPPSPVVATTTPSSTSAIYLNSSVFQRQQPAIRLAVNSNGVVRKIPENLVLKNVPLIDSQQNSVQPSPALSTASGPYIPISECFSGSPKFLVDGNNPTTPLNNLDPKFYDTPRSHNTIGLNLTNDKSYSPKITNCGGVQQPTPAAKGRSGRSDSDSESVFTDDEEWTHPMPLRESIDRNTRPSDSSVENDSFVFTYSQRFSKLPDDTSKEQQLSCKNDLVEAGCSEKLDKELKNNLTVDEKTTKDAPQFSDTENASPAMGPGDAKSVVDENYDIPRSHYLPYCNMDQLFKKATSPEDHSIVTSTPNLIVEKNGSNSPLNTRTLPRPHCYTNAAPSKKEENVFRYDFMEQTDLPPVNRNLKPKVGLEDKPPEEKPAKPPLSQPIKIQHPANMTVEGLTSKMMLANIHGTSSVHNKSAPVTAAAAAGPVATVNTSAAFNADNLVLHPPSVDRKLKPNAYKLGNSATIGPSSRRSLIAPLSMVLDDENESKYIMEACTLPRHPRPTKYTMTSAGLANAAAIHSAGYSQQQRIALAKAGIQMMHSPLNAMLLMPKNEHKLQYFDLDVSNPPPVVHRQSMSVGNLNAPTATAATISRFALPADPSARAPIKSGVVYNSVDFIKTEAFNRVREERIRETEVIKILNK